MTLTLAYDTQLSRVRATGDTLPASAVTATLERKDGVRWVLVRGAGELTLETYTGADTLTYTRLPLPVDDYEFHADALNTYRLTTYDSAGAQTSSETATITPDLGGQPWLKIVARPFLNRPVTVLNYGDIERSARAGVHQVVGRSFPVVVSDIRGSREYELQLVTEGDTAREEMDLTLASGEPIFLHVPADCDVPGGYFHVGQTAETRPSRRSHRRLFRLPLVEVAAPGPDVVGATSTWTSVLNTYATWQDVLDAEPTWQDLLELIGQPTDVIVP